MIHKLRIAIYSLAALALTAVAAEAAPRVTITYAHCCAPEHTYGVYAHELADRVAELSGGEIKIEVLDGGVMGPEQAIAQKVALGTVQMAGITSNNVAQLAPSLNVLNLPYLNASQDDLTGEHGLLRAGPYRDELNRRVLAESGSLRVIGGFTNAFRSLLAKDACISNIEDLQGLKIRAPKNPVMTAMWESWGVSTYPIDWGETFGAVATGVIDAFDSPTDVVLDLGFHEHIKFITEATYLPLSAVVVINEPFFESLSEEDRAIILQAADETDIAHAEYVQSNKERVHKALVEDYGVTFCELEDPEVWAERAQGAWPQLFALVGGGEDWVDTTVNYRDTGKID